MSKIAAVRIRGVTGIKKEIKDTMKMLRLYKKNSCVILEDNKNYRSMLNKVKDYVTFGEIDDETLKLLEQKKGKKKTYRLHPPRKGYGRKGIKVSFTKSGALGDRKEKINDLLKRMI